MGKVIIGIFAIFLLIGAFASPITSGIHTWRTIDTSQNELVTTGVGVTSSNVTLDSELYQASTGEIQSISSNITETPIASGYTEATQVLLVTSLSANQTRTLTIDYYAETDDTTMQAIGPFLTVLIFGGCTAAIAFGMWHKKR